MYAQSRTSTFPSRFASPDTNVTCGVVTEGVVVVTVVADTDVVVESAVLTVVAFVVTVVGFAVVVVTVVAL